MEKLTIGGWILVAFLYLIAGILLFALLHSQIDYVKKHGKFFGIAFIFFWPLSSAISIILLMLGTLSAAIFETFDAFKKNNK